MAIHKEAAWKWSLRAVVSITTCFALQFASADEYFPIVAKQQALVDIVIPANSPSEVQMAAERFQWYVQAISQAYIPIVNDGQSPQSSESACHIFIGNTRQSAKYLDELKQRKADPESSLVVTDGAGNVHIVGVDPIGTLHAVYFLLEDFGCRWYFPADWGTVIPNSESLAIKAQHKFRSPDFKLRSGLFHTTTRIDEDPTWAAWEWGRGNHLGGWSSWGSGHSYRHLIPPEYFAKHPDWFALVDGKRIPDQLCLTHPEGRAFALDVVKKAMGSNPPNLVCISPNDTKANKFCQCDNCAVFVRQLPDGTGKDFSEGEDRIIAYANYFADALRDDFPNTLFTYYADYHSYVFPNLQKPASNSAPSIVHWRGDQFHGQSDNTIVGKTLSNWGQFHCPIIMHTYWGSHTSWGFWPVVHTLENDIRYYHSKGVVGVYSETHENWGTEHLNFIVFPRLLWNKDIDVDELVDEFCHKFYGPAANPMRRYYALMEEAAEKGPQQLRYRQWLIPVFTPEVLTKMRQCFIEAHSLIEGHAEVYRQRLDFVYAGFQIADNYYSAEHLMRANSKQKNSASRDEILQLLRRSIAVLDDPRFHDLQTPGRSHLLESSLPEVDLPAQLRTLLSQHEQGTGFSVEDSVYFEDYYLGGRTFIDAKHKEGFKDGLYGLVLDADSKGTLIYQFDTKNAGFENVHGYVVVSNSILEVPISVEISTKIDGPWVSVLESAATKSSQEDPSDQRKFDFDLTAKLVSHSRFFLRIQLDNQTETDRHVLHQLHLDANVRE